MSAQFQFVMRSGPNPGLVYPLEGNQLTIGRDPGNALVINDTEVSRRHTRLSWQGSGYVMEDLGSTNGTFVNGQRLGGPYVLQVGDLVSLGEQIVLAYEEVPFDPNATIVSPKSAGRASAAKPSPARPVPQSFAGEVPQGPTPTAPSFDEKPRFNTMQKLAIGCSVIFLCGCLSLLVYLYFAPPTFYCSLVPFLFPGACP